MPMKRLTDRQVVTAIGDTLDEARQRYYGVKAAVDVAAERGS